MMLRRWDEVQAVLPPLSLAERRALADSIRQDGVKVPILALPDGRIIDGHHRWELSGGTPLVDILDIPEERAFALALALNLARRQLSADQIGVIHERLRQDASARRQTARDLRDAGLTQAQAAAVVGVTRQAVDFWEEDGRDARICNPSLPAPPDHRVSVPRHAHAAIAARADAGEPLAAIAADYKVTPRRIGQIVAQHAARQRRPAPAAAVPLPEARYRCLVIDPPWPIQKIERNERPNQGQALDYPTMTLNEIGALPVASLVDPDGCHLYLWVTQRFLPAGLALVERWGFRYQCLLTWIKPTGMTPYSWMYNTEHVIFARRGSLPLERLGLKLSIEAPAMHHSAKPDLFYERVVLASPGQRLDLFARRARDGFDTWGNEVTHGTA